ncbi:efflux transporter outer membrane subunit [Celerinatantimonas sp. MCCC 1A17872]|uniref:efflux transporter outer membrane subunit n=1 Tax=Celerinatantimonas sp. MCCC 1A17872 TaxID=3177514 RepID=UPI0038C86BE6
MGKHYRITLSVAVVVALSGCTTIHDKRTADIKAVTNYQTEHSFQTKHFSSWPKQNWWQHYQDPQLNQLIETALKDSPTIEIAKARLAQAKGYAKEMGAVKKVQISANAQASQQKVSYQYQAYMPPHGWNDYASLGLDFHYDFDFWGKNRSLVAAATSQLQAAKAEQASAKLMLATAIANQYAELTRLYANQDTILQALSIRQKTANLIEKRHHFGLENEGAVYRSKSAYSSEQADLSANIEQIKLAKSAISALVGTAPDTSAQITRPTVKLSHDFGLPQNARIGLLGHRPDIVAARWQVQARAHQSDIAKASFYPDLSLSAFFGFQSYGINHLFRENNTAGSVGPALYLPIFKGGELHGKLDQARARYRQAVANYDNTLNHALHQVADTVVKINSLTQRLQHTQDAVDSAKKAYLVAFDRYHGGLANYLDVLTAEDVFVKAKQQLADLQTRAFSLNIALMHALGGGYQQSSQS